MRLNSLKGDYIGDFYRGFSEGTGEFGQRLIWVYIGALGFCIFVF